MSQMTRSSLNELIDVSAYQAAVFDLDGVVTRTADLHGAAWKAMFDAFLRSRADQQGSSQAPFDEHADYLAYVDGKPRIQGVADFLAARGISIPPGTPQDPPTAETQHGLGARKNELFLQLLETQGIEVYQSTLAVIGQLRAAGLRTALVTSSENGAAMLEQAGIAHLFDARVDGVDALRMGLQGKPNPDVFVAATQALGVPPGKAIAVEDALSGVQSAVAAGYALVVGVDRSGQLEQKMLELGAHIVLSDLSLLGLIHPQAIGTLPDAMDQLESLLEPLAEGRELRLFLDYDGTLAAIADRPDQARLGRSVRELLGSLAASLTVSIVSGRDREDLECMVGLPELVYAGSHGMDIRGPDGLAWQHEAADATQPALDIAQRQLQQAIGDIPGVLIERKRFVIAVHFRLVQADAVDRVRMVAADTVRRAASQLRLTCGKCVVELRPCLDWDKGQAVAWLLDRPAAAEQPFALYIGDDETDEDAFRMMRRLGGVGICVGSGSRPTSAQYHLDSPAQVEALLTALVQRLSRTQAPPLAGVGS
jgi:trehalose 6-phosphate phosphatase